MDVCVSARTRSPTSRERKSEFRGIITHLLAGGGGVCFPVQLQRTRLVKDFSIKAS